MCGVCYSYAHPILQEPKHVVHVHAMIYSLIMSCNYADGVFVTQDEGQDFQNKTKWQCVSADCIVQSGG
jgi:hypothetical protein